MVTERYFNEIDFCCIFNNSFQLRISKPRKLKYLLSNMLTGELSYKPLLHIKFTVEDKKKLNY